MNTRPNNWRHWPSKTLRLPLVTTISQTLRDACQQLQPASPTPAVDARLLLCHVIGCTSSHLMAWPEQELTAQQAAAFSNVLQRRSAGEPVAYITGEREFWSLSLTVSSAVLIPRPETETLVEFVLQLFSDRADIKMADLGTGSGAIACALAAEHPQWDIVATDISAPALKIARSNAAAHQLTNIRFLQGAWFEPLTEQNFDLIISNPPYVAIDDRHLSAGDLRFEPEAALASGELGLDAITLLTRQAGAYLAAGGWLIVEHGYDQQQAVHDCFKQGGFEEIVQLSDLAALPRATAGRYLQSGT